MPGGRGARLEECDLCFGRSWPRAPAGVQASGSRAILLGRTAKRALELLVKIALVGKAGFVGDLGDGMGRLLEQPGRVGQAHMVEITDQSHPGRLFERFHELGGAHVNQARGVAHREFLSVVARDVLEQGLEPQRPLLLADKLPLQHLGTGAVPGQMIKQRQKRGFAPGLPQLRVVFGEEPLQELRHGRGRRRGLRVPCPEQMRLILRLGVERQQERVIVRGRAQAVHKLGHETGHHHARVKTRKIHHVMELGIVHNQQIAPGQPDLLVPHPEARRTVQRQEQLQPLVPGRPPGMAPGRVVEELDDKRKLPV